MHVHFHYAVNVGLEARCMIVRYMKLKYIVHSAQCRIRPFRLYCLALMPGNRSFPLRRCKSVLRASLILQNMLLVAPSRKVSLACPYVWYNLRTISGVGTGVVVRSREVERTNIGGRFWVAGRTDTVLTEEEADVRRCQQSPI